MESDNDRVSALVSGSVAGALEHLQSQMEQYERDHAFEDNVTIHSGHLYKTGQGFLGGTWQLRYFELKMHTLVYKTEKGEQRVIDLSKGCTLTDEAVAASRSFKGQALTTFSIIPHKAGRIYSIGGANPQEVLNWKDAIRTQIFRTPLKFGGVKRFDARVSLHEGFLWKLGESKIRKWNKRYFVLFSDSLQYYREWEESKPAGVIMLTVGSSLKLIHNTEKSGLERIFRLFDVCPHPGSQKSKGWLASNRTYHIACAEQALLDVWVEKIQNQIPLTSRVMNGVFQPASFSTFLLKRNHIHRNGKQYRFELSISNLQYFDEKDKLAGSFGIHEIQSVNPDVSANRRFTISLKEKGKLVKLEAFTREECSEWVQRLDAIIRANIDFKESDLVKEEEEQVNSVKQLVMSIKLRCRDTFFHPMFVKVSCTGSRTREQIQQRERAEAELAQAEDGGRSLRGKKKSRIAARSLPGPFEHKLDEVGALPTGPTLSRYNSQPSHKKSMTVDSFSVVPALESKVDADSSSRFDCDANSDGDETVQNAISDLDETAVEFSSDSDYSDEGDAEKDWKEFVPADPLQSRKQDIYHSLEFLGITPVTSFDTRCAEELIGWYDGTWREVMKTEMLWRQDRSHQGEYAFKILFTFDVDQLEVFMQQQQQQEQEDAEGECKRARVDGDNDVALFRFDIIENQGREIMDSYVKSRAEKLVAAVKIPSEEIWKLYDGSKREVFSNIKVPHQQIDRDVLCLTRIEVRSVNECGNGKFRNRSYLFVDKDQQHVVVHEQLQRSPFTFSAPCSLLEHYLRLYETRKMLIEKQIEALQQQLDSFPQQSHEMTLYRNGIGLHPYAHEMQCLSMLNLRLGKLHQAIYRYKRLASLYRNNQGDYRNFLFKPSSSKSDHALQFLATNLHVHSMVATTHPMQKLQCHTNQPRSAVIHLNQQTNLAKLETAFEITTVGAFAAHNFKFKNGGVNLEVASLRDQLHKSQVEEVNSKATMKPSKEQPGCLSTAMNLDLQFGREENSVPTVFQTDFDMPAAPAHKPLLAVIALPEEVFRRLPANLRCDPPDYNPPSPDLTPLPASPFLDMSKIKMCWTYQEDDQPLIHPYYLPANRMVNKDTTDTKRPTGGWLEDVCEKFLKIHDKGWDLMMRKEVVSTQAFAAILTSFCAHLTRNIDNEQVLTGIAECGFLVQVESLLSSIGNENGMIMDKVYATRSLKNVQFALVCQTADGELPAGLPDPILASNLFPTFDPSYKAKPPTMPSYPLPTKSLIKITPLIFSRGVNEQQWLANQRDKIKFVVDKDLHTRINEQSLAELRAYFNDYKVKISHNQNSLPPDKRDTTFFTTLFPTIEEELTRLSKAVDDSKDRYDNNDLSVLSLTNALVRKIGGSRIVCCKSAKDRTSMSTTLQQVQHLVDIHQVKYSGRESRGVDSSVNAEDSSKKNLLNFLRTYGLRRDNVIMNTGKPYFAFNATQTKFLPRDFKPPPSTCSNKTAS
eukprot:CAMPEP_0175127238 /NCGR_PEP_ID=MMETSP0087-20121206/4285_1 /TAXON_ID=136419 /ORGANISM="Unknown Unknown, Strain D1" /LENGTH=1482 /DNA_ID=CAMNT_0016409213 /DNA_START=48 /DNA_END=4496 /DNA_ORIENTATION=+